MSRRKVVVVLVATAAVALTGILAMVSAMAWLDRRDAILGAPPLPAIADGPRRGEIADKNLDKKPKDLEKKPKNLDKKPRRVAQHELRPPMREWQTDGVCCVDISPDGATVAAGVVGNMIRLWNVASGKEQASLKADFDVHSVAFSPDGKKLAAGMAYNNIAYWDVATGKCTTLLHHPEPKGQNILIFASPLVVFSPDSKTVASAGKCIGEIRLWNVSTGKETATIEIDDSFGVRALAFTPDGKTLASMGANGTSQLWDLPTGNNIATHKMVEWTPNAAFSPDAKMLAMVGDAEEKKDGKVLDEYRVKLWEVATRKELAMHKIEWGGAMTFSSDGKTFALGRDDGTILLWDVSQGKGIDTINAHADLVGALAFSANGRLLASGSRDESVKLWDWTKAK